MKAEGKILVVTGAGSGMGREVTLEALRRGAKVAASDINEATLAETATLAAAGDRLTTNLLERGGQGRPWRPFPMPSPNGWARWTG